MVKKRWIKWLLRGKLLLIRGSREMKGVPIYRAFFIYEETFILHFNIGPPKEYKFTHIKIKP